MSAEGLFLLALFILFPLIERILQSARQRNTGTPDRPTEVPRPSRPSMRRPPPPPPLIDSHVPRTPDVPPLSATLAARPSPRLQLAAPPERHATRRCIPVGDLHNPITLRRAIVLMTILAPCRALTPHEWEAASGRGPS
jgi:hypothetical protein